MEDPLDNLQNSNEFQNDVRKVNKNTTNDPLNVLKHYKKHGAKDPLYNVAHNKYFQKINKAMYKKEPGAMPPLNNNSKSNDLTFNTVILQPKVYKSLKLLSGKRHIPCGKLASMIISKYMINHKS